MRFLTNQVERLVPMFRRHFDRFWAIAGAVSVRTKILGIVLGLVLILGAGVTLQVRLTLRDALSHDLQSQGSSISRDVAARSVDLLLVRDLYAVHQLLQDTRVNNDDVRYAFVVSPKGEILAQTARIFRQLDDEEFADRVERVIDVVDEQFHPAETALQVCNKLLHLNMPNGSVNNR